MNLPELAWQVAYGRLAWAVVLAAVAVGLWSHARPPTRAGVAAALLLATVLVCLPGRASPTHWLGLAFQWPSPMGVALCALCLRAHWQQQVGCRPMPVALAVVIALAGLLLYLDASGWLALGLYAAGFGPKGAPMLALLLAGLCVLALNRHVHRAQAAALLAALTLFMVLRLPTGNLWDALLDPFVWVWALLSLLSRVSQWRRARQPAAARPPVPAVS